uniref:NAC domain-containing protein n=1 Tax=Ananas comosus var. bracteatus TaxID=296719 RepID=A0A6V7QKZ1_ANACO|nr:unnamed protein product [Ananas comosus var. bracteatus]
MESYAAQHHRFDSGDAQLPPGFRFHPTDEELITYYLLKKVLDGGFTGRAIAEIDLNKCEPWELPGPPRWGERVVLLQPPRPQIPDGAADEPGDGGRVLEGDGEGQGDIQLPHGLARRDEEDTGVLPGRAPKGEKSNWVMHEYRLDGKFAYHFLSRSSKDEWVVSRVFQKIGGGKKTRLGLAGPSNSDAAGGGGGSQSSSSLPLLLDSSPFTGAAASFASADRESCSYESTDREPVPCFSTTAAHLLGNEATPPPLFGRVAPAPLLPLLLMLMLGWRFRASARSRRTSSSRSSSPASRRRCRRCPVLVPLLPSTAAGPTTGRSAAPSGCSRPISIGRRSWAAGPPTR